MHLPKAKNLTVLHMEALLHVKKALKEGNEHYKPALSTLLRAADKALNSGPYSVTNKSRTPISGDKKDYLSIGYYWWPDPQKPEGLPWIRKDGQKNPSVDGDGYDLKRKNKMFNNTYRLALAHFFTGNPEYADKAIELLKVWFLNPETSMNPNLNYAQGIPGKNHGRGIGIIEFIGILDIITAIELLEQNDTLDTRTSQGLRHWMAAYLNWLQTSENGVFEKNTKNNHSTWYDAQEVGLLLFLNRADEAKAVLEKAKEIRIPTQITADGRQPLELARTRPLHYSIYNLMAFTHLANFGKKLEVDLWNYTPTTGGGIKSAFHFLHPFAKGKKEWQLTEISSLDEETESLQELFLMAGSIFDVSEFCKIDKAEKFRDSFNLLLYPCPL